MEPLDEVPNALHLLPLVATHELAHCFGMDYSLYETNFISETIEYDHAISRNTRQWARYMEDHYRKNLEAHVKPGRHGMPHLPEDVEVTSLITHNFGANQPATIKQANFLRIASRQVRPVRIHRAVDRGGTLREIPPDGRGEGNGHLLRHSAPDEAGPFDGGGLFKHPRRDPARNLFGRCPGSSLGERPGIAGEGLRKGVDEPEPGYGREMRSGMKSLPAA
jgi:hypothetical protein